VRIAYLAIGAGPSIIHMPMSAFSHAARERALPLMRAWYEGLAQHHTVVRYDMRGFGSSDRDASRISPGSQLLDLEAVAARSTSEPFVLFAMLEQARTAITYAARHPQRVTRLVLWNSAHPQSFKGFDHDAGLSFNELKHRDWRRFVDAWSQALWGWSRSEHAQLWADAMVDGASPESLDAFRASEATRDVSRDMRHVLAPTLVVCHRRFDGSEAAAASIINSIENAHLLTLDEAYVPWAGNVELNEALPIVLGFSSAQATQQTA
jgi:pimeloyl-ACP methyl ester carboxylesterase